MDPAVTPHQCRRWESEPQWLDATVCLLPSLCAPGQWGPPHRQSLTRAPGMAGRSSTIQKASSGRMVRQGVLLQGLTAPPLQGTDCHIVTPIFRKASPTLYLTLHPVEVILAKSALPLPQLSKNENKCRILILKCREKNDA